MEAAWNAFGSDSDSESSESENEATDRREEAKRLMQQYNTQSNTQINPKSDSNTASNISFLPSFDDQHQRTALLPWPAKPPLYLGPAYVEKLTLGGGRGYTATADLPPGTCILIEEPLVKGWSEQQMGKRLGLESIQHLLEMNDPAIVKNIVLFMEELHPTKEKVDSIFNHTDEDISPLDLVQIFDMIAMMENDEFHCQQVKKLVSYAKSKGITSSDDTYLSSRDINRLLLTLRYNGFDSGLYLNFSIFNHDEDPNCIKFRPSTDGTQQRYYSEARTTRFVKKGEALTVSLWNHFSCY